MNNLIKLSHDIQNSIFQYNINEFNKQVVELISFLTEELENSVKNKNEEMVLIIRKIIDNFNFAFCNKDYLLFADILKYELETNFEIN